MRIGRNMGKVGVAVLLAAVVVGIGVLLHARAGAPSTSSGSGASGLDGLWYGPLSITRFDNAQKPTEHLSEAFYLKLGVDAAGNITGTYTTCSLTAPVKQSALDEYTMETGVLSPNGKTINLYLFAPMYGTFSGSTLALQGQRYALHSDAITDEYASTLRKVSGSTYLSACHVIPG